MESLLTQAARLAPRTPDAGDERTELSHLQWLLDGPTRDAAGGVRSWANPAHPGFDYLEAAGLLLSLHAEALQRDAHPAVLNGGTEAHRDRVRQDGARIARWITARLDPDGVVRHEGVRYAFDTSIVVAALSRWAAVGGAVPAGTMAAIDGGRAFLRRCLSRRIGQEGAPADGHWSRGFGPHLLKLAIALPAEDLAGPAEELLRQTWRGRWFETGVGAPYPHAHAYALEGLLLLRDAGLSVPLDVLGSGYEALLEACDRRMTPSDVLAQTARIGLLSGLPSRRSATDALLTALRARAVDGGGLRYAAESRDLNTWATIFHVQALRWARLGPSALHLA